MIYTVKHEPADDPKTKCNSYRRVKLWKVDPQFRIKTNVYALLYYAVPCCSVNRVHAITFEIFDECLVYEPLFYLLASGRKQNQLQINSDQR